MADSPQHAFATALRKAAQLVEDGEFVAATYLIIDQHGQQDSGVLASSPPATQAMIGGLTALAIDCRLQMRSQEAAERARKPPIIAHPSAGAIQEANKSKLQ